MSAKIYQKFNSLSLQRSSTIENRVRKRENIGVRSTQFETQREQTGFREDVIDIQSKRKKPKKSVTQVKDQRRKMEERAGRYSHIIFKAYIRYENIDFKS